MCWTERPTTNLSPKLISRKSEFGQPVGLRRFTGSFCKPFGTLLLPRLMVLQLRPLLIILVFTSEAWLHGGVKHVYRTATLSGWTSQTHFIHCSIAPEGADDIPTRNNEKYADILYSLVQAKSEQPSLDLLQVAASATQLSCPLLGTKSLGVDYGLVRTGMAVTVGYEPTPLGILQGFNSSESLAVEIVRIAKAEGVSRIVLGMPLHKNGTIAEQTNRTLLFGQTLATRVLSEMGPDVSIALFDERYTSKEAAARAHSRDPDRYLMGTLDADAACIILESYYSDGGQGAIDIILPDDVRVSCLQQYRCLQEMETARVQTSIAEREAKMARRKESIARFKIDNENNRIGTSSQQKKKRKKKR